ncbi:MULTISPECIES: hypothetical protein [unclassified Coleofasciculus]|uniref:hypothetical protein n=1 Tax=unclassified Coleofasciculus TaxID=2692782 RepID=UPI0018827A5D|nr:MULTISPECIES: hypothetical protein [unclassified Coleofasciculus]MBE9124940.1 hypothetical protein [Coleofasciculus sp. LEGE 07081]MBE9147964.1 hypothetical protein [Coleofasciculus sp. LEGE 07092]
MKISTPLVSALTSTLLAPIALGIAVSTAAIAITSAIVSQPAVAQSAGTVDPLEDLNRSNDVDALTGQTDGSGLSPLDWIHRLRLGTGELDEETVQKNLDTSIDEYRRQQLERLGNSQPAIPGTPSTTPGIAN